MADCKKADFGTEEAKSLFTTIKTVSESDIQTLVNEGKRTAYSSYDGAIAIYQKVLKLDADNQEAMYQMAYCYQKKNENKKAKKWYEKAIQVDESSSIAVKAKTYLEQVKEALGDTDSQ